MRLVRVEGGRESSLALSVLGERLAVCRLEAEGEMPAWATRAWFYSVTRTPDELSVVCPEGEVPDGVKHERGWRALKLKGLFDLSLAGILVSVAGPLAEVGINTFAIATYETDYLLVKEERLELAASTPTDADMLSGGMRGMSRDQIYKTREEVC